LAEDHSQEGADGRDGDDRRHHACPMCGATVYRAHRRGADRLVGVFRDVRRYHCPECRWDGLLRASYPGEGGGRSGSGGRAAAIVGATALVATVALLGYGLARETKEQPAELPLPRAGVPLDPADPRATAGVATHELRRGCAWAGPETEPYTGTFGAALASAGVPADVVAKLEVMHERELVSDRLKISSTGIESADGRRFFGQVAAAMAFGQAVCFSTRIDVPSDLDLSADLYEIIDSTNRRFAVMVIDEGDNVALLQEQMER